MTTLNQPTWILLAVIAFSGCSVGNQLHTVEEWKYIDYSWQTSEQKQDAIDAGVYDYKTIIPVDFQKISGTKRSYFIPVLLFR